MRRSTFLRTLAGVAFLGTASLKAAGPTMTVFKTTTCGCCAKWVDHLRAAGFDVTVQNVQSTAEYREKYGVPEKLASCHTALVGGYTVEGHVPAKDIQRLLTTKAKGKGLAVPGMPLGSPGMEAPKTQAYAVLLFQADGKTSVFQQYPGN
jgi:hypothetical protein